MARSLPPGQHAVDGFPRFGTHLHRPPPPVPADPAIAVAGSVREPFSIPLAELAQLPRRKLTADFHCAAGWTATDLEWEGVDFETLYARLLEPALPPGSSVCHFSFLGLDGFRSIVAAEDAFAGDLLIADRLGGRPLEPEHGAPVRLVSPRQYGYKSTKHLCGIELHTEPPRQTFPHLDAFSRSMLRSPLFGAHPRARVSQEERHPYMPGRAMRPLYYWVLRPPIKLLCSLGSGARRNVGD